MFGISHEDVALVIKHSAAPPQSLANQFADGRGDELVRASRLQEEAIRAQQQQHRQPPGPAPGASAASGPAHDAMMAAAMVVAQQVARISSRDGQATSDAAFAAQLADDDRQRLARSAADAQIRAADDAAMAERLHAEMAETAGRPQQSDPTSFECEICGEAKGVREMMFLGCDHLYCFGCMKGHAQVKLVEQSTVPGCPSCGELLPETEVKAIYADDPDARSIHAKIEQLFLQRFIGQSNAVGCPKAGCTNSMIPSDPESQEPMACSCGTVYCSQCQANAHGRTITCEQADTIAHTWYWWIERGNREFMEWRAGEDAGFASQLREFEARAEAHNAEFQDAARARRELEQDEQWKATNCKRCPHCRNPVNKLEGCDSMKCGGDYHGGNGQPGCGRRFHWSTALPYEADVDRAGPAAFDEVAPDLATEDILVGRTPSGRGITLPCDRCQQEMSQVAFRCINCPAEFTVCHGCHGFMTQGEHDGSHVFNIMGTYRRP